jgi:hypothetical protein
VGVTIAEEPGGDQGNSKGDPKPHACGSAFFFE